MAQYCIGITMILLHHTCSYISNDADWVIFVHGAGGSSKTWDKQLTVFAKYYNVLVMDLRDHGKSKNIEPAYNSYKLQYVVDDIFKLIDHLNIKSAHFITLSMGSFLMQRIAIQRPDLIKKCVLAGAVFSGTWQLRWFTRLALVFNNLFTYKQMYSIFSWILMPRKNHQLARRLYKIQAYKLTPKEYLKWVSLYDDFFSTLDEFRNWKLRIPTLVLMGDQDYVFRSGAFKFLKRQPNAKLEFVSSAGHVCNIDNPKEFNERCLNFLKA